MNFTVTLDQFNLGSHFLIWSIYYLSGQEKYYMPGHDAGIELPADPIAGVTAHNMKINWHTCLTECKQDLEIMSHTEKLYHIRYIPDAKTIKQYSEYNKQFQRLSIENKIKTFNIGCKDLQHLIAFLRYNRPEYNWQHNLDLVKKHCLHRWPDFFTNKEIFNDKLESFHDIREQIAFNIRPYDYWTQMDHEEEIGPVFRCDFENTLVNPEQEFERIFNFLDMKINKQRIDQWLKIHQRWSSNIIPIINFCNNVEKIADAIVSGTDMDLEKYNLDVLKEGVILHLLMYKHNLNFSNPINRLPNSTQQIHLLLSKNNRTGIENLYVS